MRLSFVRAGADVRDRVDAAMLLYCDECVSLFRADAPSGPAIEVKPDAAGPMPRFENPTREEVAAAGYGALLRPKVDPWGERENE